MGTITGMIEPDKVAFSVEMTGINGISRMPYIPGTTSLRTRNLQAKPSWRWAERIANPSIERSVAGFLALRTPHPSQVSRPCQSYRRISIELDESANS
jgi:hypothetical protein